ncbi:sensor histidine kinase [Actinomarinicola tropica]|uniref:histidine kinase n=1 Tax=Actinomarinicola tropica TaxID=2789776 RepID=A0A5Q2RFQ6_9ACTN|nr:sensor histidine kinase [Actinomarinicola tropica]QGG95658.1 sensor histidine kinase [Actinomarinicola tropica]
MTEMHVRMPPAGPPGHHDEDERCVGWFEGLGRDSVYVFLQFPLTLASFVAMVTGLALSAGLIVLVVGLPVLVIVLGLARVFATLQREVVTIRGHQRIEPGLYRRPEGTSAWRRWLLAVRTPQPWLDALHGVVSFPLGVATFVVATTMWAVVLNGFTFWFWQGFVDFGPPEENTTLPELLNWDIPEAVLYLLMGLVGLALLRPVIQLCAAMHEGLARLLLDNSRVRELEERVRQLDTARSAAAQAEVASLRRLERDLHDGPQQRLVRLGMDLAVAERRLESSPESAREAIAEARRQAAETLEELRALSRGIAPPILADRGLEPALTAMAARSPVPTEVDVRLGSDSPLDEPVETAAYFVASEALANVAKHAQATRVIMSVRRDGEELVVEVEDDGAGGATVLPGHGLSGLADRVEALGGRLDVSSPAGGPTRLVARIPCAS